MHGSEWDRPTAVGLIKHEQGAGELCRSQVRVRLAVTAWLRGLRLAETFELDGSQPDDGPTLRHLVETATGAGARVVLTAGDVDSERLEAALVWSGLQALPVHLDRDGAGDEVTPPSPTPPSPTPHSPTPHSPTPHSPTPHSPTASVLGTSVRAGATPPTGTSATVPGRGTGVHAASVPGTLTEPAGTDGSLPVGAEATHIASDRRPR